MSNYPRPDEEITPSTLGPLREAPVAVQLRRLVAVVAGSCVVSLSIIFFFYPNFFWIGQVLKPFTLPALLVPFVARGRYALPAAVMTPWLCTLITQVCMDTALIPVSFSFRMTVECAATTTAIILASSSGRLSWWGAFLTGVLVNRTIAWFWVSASAMFDSTIDLNAELSLAMTAMLGFIPPFLIVAGLVLGPSGYLASESSSSGEHSFE